MQRLGLHQSLQQKLSPQQIQFIKLLQVPTAELENRIEEELELNPVLEEGEDEEPEENRPEEAPEQSVDSESPSDEQTSEEPNANDEIDINDYLRDDDYTSYKTYNDDGDEEEREMPMPTSTSLHETLTTQLGFLGLNEKQNLSLIHI